jgi:uncharacterized membrane protein YhhN
MVLILLIAVLGGKAGDPFYRYAITTGLLCSLAGDVLLMLPSDHFIAGLVSFLVAHLFYTVAFVSETGFGFALWPLALLVICGIALFRVLQPYLGEMRIPVLVYAAVIVVMAWQAWARWSQTGQRAPLMAAIGATLFAISDSALAIHRFRGEFGSAHVVILSTYFAAQWLIALSVDQGLTL